MRLEDGGDPVAEHQPPDEAGPRAVQVDHVGLGVLDDPATAATPRRAQPVTGVGAGPPPRDLRPEGPGLEAEVAVGRAGDRHVPAPLHLVPDVAEGDVRHAVGGRHRHVQDVQPAGREARLSTTGGHVVRPPSVRPGDR